MLMAKRVEVQFALLPLLHRDFQVRSLALIEPRIALETDAKGVGNWDFSSAPASAGAPKTAAPDATATMGGFFVGDFSISNGALTYLDGETGKLTTVTIATLGLKARDPHPGRCDLPRQRGRHRVTVDGTLGPRVLPRQALSKFNCATSFVGHRRWSAATPQVGTRFGPDGRKLTKCVAILPCCRRAYWVHRWSNQNIQRQRFVRLG
jgi:uncharacterized protein involved in outer membrane biogenesis